jgi:glutamate---cysteine ligase / carboxylate-amine ligase
MSLSPSSSPHRGLFEGFGVELEYMIVDRGLNVLPIADRLLSSALGQSIATVDCGGEVERGAARWSNELVRHVIEMKTNGPADSLEGLAPMFQRQVTDALAWLEVENARLLPTGMHPWMDPDREMQLWPYDYREVYEAFDQVFDCRGHGWANLQSVHLNLPFADEEEFGRLHAAVRLLLPLLPALSASSPYCDGKRQAGLDHRLYVYMNNARRIPSVTGEIIPEPVYTYADYRREILETMYRDIAALDPSGVLQHEWLNARGAIAKFARQTIEIRILDVQECPAADLAICAAAVEVLRELVSERWSSFSLQKAFPTGRLASMLKHTVMTADATIVEERDYLELLGLANCSGRTAGELWQEMFQRMGDAAIPDELRKPLEVILQRGPLARRMIAAAGSDESPVGLSRIFEQLADCLAAGEMLRGR